MSDFILKKPAYFSLSLILDCGQAFRWEESEGVWSGIARNKFLRVRETDDSLIFYNTSKEDFESFWKGYFDLERDYSVIKKSLKGNDLLTMMHDSCSGIRILNQEPWETLCSFIISQNNNIPRIKGIIKRLCETFGEKIDGGFTFPSAEKIASLSIEKLKPLKCGFRDKYILDAALKVSSGQVDLASLPSLSIEEAREELKKILGVGNKVADCTLLYGLGFVEAFPRDVWINKSMAELFPDGLPLESLKFAGIIQQYIFHYVRTNDILV